MAATIARIRALDITHDAAPVRFDAALEAAIAAHWERRVAANPRLFDGNILLFRDVAVDDGVLRATAVTVSYRVLAALLDLKPAGLELVNLYGAAAPMSADGGLLLGRMAPHTFEPGAIKLASGTPDLDDLDRPGGRVDLDGSIARELLEETGLDTAADAETGANASSPEYLFVRDGPYLAVVRWLRYGAPGDRLAARVNAFLAADPDPELTEAVIVRDPGDPVLADAGPLVKPIAEALLSERGRPAR